MKLRHMHNSPFVRKVVVSAIETGLHDGIERIPTDVFDPADDLGDVNPLRKVPALTTADGAVLYDSAVICEYLDSLHDGARLVPGKGPGRWRVLRLQALSDGILDAGVLRRLESLRPEGERSATWDAHQKAKMDRGLDTLERDAAHLEGALDLAQIAIGCALGWLDFRFGHEPWRAGRPRLATWYDGFARRPSMVATAPKA